MAPSGAPRTPPRLRAAGARVERIKTLQERVPAKHKLFPVVSMLLKAALLIQMVVAGVEQLRMLTTMVRPDYYYEDGRPPAPYTFDELVRKHHARFKDWFRVDTPQ